MKYYKGNKNIEGVYQKILNNIPKHNFYYELYCGSAAIYFELILSVPAGREVKYHLNDLDRSATDKLSCSGRLDTLRSNYDALNLIKMLIKADKKRFIFLDPPYLHSTRPSATKLYKYELSDNDHIQLLLNVLQLKCNVMIIHPKCDLYDTMLSSWRKVEIKIRYHNKTSVECLYMNYEPGELQTSKYLGTDCWDRQRIKRKAKSLIKKLAALPDQERQYIMTEIEKNFN